MAGTVLIEYVEPVEQQSSLVMPSEFQREERRTGRVVGVADFKHAHRKLEDGSYEHLKLPMSVSVGDYVLFKRHSADVLTIAGHQFFSVNDDDILATTDDPKTFESLRTVEP